MRGVGIELDARLIALARCHARETNRRLRAKLLTELKPGARIVSHRFDLGDWLPERSAQSEGHPILLWIVPARPR